MTRVMGLDLSLTATGVCLPDGTVYTTGGPAKLGDHRLVIIANTIAVDAQRHKVELAVVEDLPVHGNAAGATGMVQGAVRYALQRLTIPYALVSPATLKAFATGTGRGEKRDMAVAAYKRDGREFKDDNQCDAWWCWQAGLHWLGHATFDLPKTQVARLDKAKWPPDVSRMEIP